MARPRSEDKQIALLEAATEIVAAQGLGAPTSLIAKRAGVAEGTLFRYFATKDVLLNALYLHQSRKSTESLQSLWDESVPLKDCMKTMWNAWIDWGVAHPIAFSAMMQLEVSDKLTLEVREEAWKMWGDFLPAFDSLAVEGLPGSLSGEFLNAVSTAIAQAVVDFTIKHPECGEACKTATFNMTWNILEGKQ